jgi:predicted transposase/invertase (TIGR01784 family)
MRAERALTKVSRDMEKWARALFREKAEMDYYSAMATARDTARDQGLAEGLAEGKAKGLAEGYERAKQESYREKLEIARKMKTGGLPVAEIVTYTGIDAETVEKM